MTGDASDAHPPHADPPATPPATPIGSHPAPAPPANGAIPRLSMPLSELDAVSPARARALERLELRTVNDLLRHLPLRYELEREESVVVHLTQGTVGAARGQIVAARFSPRRGRSPGRFEATLEDATGRLMLVWFNAAWMRDKIHPGMWLQVQGKVQQFRGYPQMANPKWEVFSPDLATPQAKDERLRPIYPATEGLPSAVIEKLIARILPDALGLIGDPLPEAFRQQRELPSLADAYRMAHAPEHEDETRWARRRLAYNELLLLQLGMAVKRHYHVNQSQAPALRWSDALDRHIRERFHFTLTAQQDHVLKDIVADLQRPQPMNRLVQGDVGSGKTVIALYAVLMAVANGRQGAIMAPTELLAEQHHQSIQAMLEGSSVRIELLTGGRSTDRAAKADLLGRIARGEVDLVVGTHALVSDAVSFHDLAVVVVDEQHRFGVMQRARFRQKSADPEQPDRSPHYLVMTATPIPRTLSLTVFGDLDVSTVMGLPPGRSPIITRVVGSDRSDDVYAYMRKRIERGEQAYVVAPTIDESGQERANQLRNVRDLAKSLQERFFEGYVVGTMHGQMKPESRRRIMDRFRDGRIHVLVATTVIEVGVDVPAATMMVIEHAERFGLAQLHQLRGRIGRGANGVKIVCTLIADPTTDEGRRRIEAIASTSDGFRIAEHDLEIRGMGDFFGPRQSGLPPLRVARIPDDLDLLQMARRDARAIVDADPKLSRPEHARLGKVLWQTYGESMGLIDVG